MKEYLGKKILWVSKSNRTRLWLEQVRCDRVSELSPSGEYVRLGGEQWYPVAYVHMLEILDEGEAEV